MIALEKKLPQINQTTFTYALIGLVNLYPQLVSLCFLFSKKPKIKTSICSIALSSNKGMQTRF